MTQVTGYFDGVFAGHATGWVEAGAGNASIVHIFDAKGNHLAQGTANKPRPDLADNGFGFRIRLPERILAASGAMLVAIVDGCTQPLPNSPLIITHGARFEWLVDGFSGSNTLTGWLKDISDPDRIFDLVLLEGDREISLSDTSRMVDDGGAKGRFEFALPPELADSRLHELELRIVDPDLSLGSFPILVRPADLPVPRVSDFPFYAEATLEMFPVSRSERGNIKQLCPEELPGIANDFVLDAEAPEAKTDFVSLARRCEEAGNTGKALAYWQKAIRQEPAAGALHASYANCLYHAAREREALALLQSLPPRLRRSSDVVSMLARIRSLYRNKSAKIIAFYLPQFHPTAENDVWWGKGFTEWQNVTAARPLFDGHRQPRAPLELGYYDLRLPETANAQFRLAREYGIDGFCYYFYWFNGKRLLEQPLDDLVSGRTGPFPFCICWANEPWTRSWDGESGETLIGQTHTLKSDNKFIEDAIPYLAHPGYIRHDDKPVLLVYRVDKLADPVKTARYWREYCRAAGIGEILLCYVQSFAFYVDPARIGFDAGVEFPPHFDWKGRQGGNYQKELRSLKDAFPDATGHVYDYGVFSRACMEHDSVPYPVFRASMLAWDNSPRRRENGTIFDTFTPAQHLAWLWHNIGRGARENGNTLVFINAWNEWAESTTLEPDNWWGYANLASVSRAKAMGALAWHGTYWRDFLPLAPDQGNISGLGVVLVGHDALASGAQINLLLLARALKLRLRCNVTIILLSGGQLQSSYERLGRLYALDNTSDPAPQLAQIARNLHDQGLRNVICNTCATGSAHKIFADSGFRVVHLIHELPALIAEHQFRNECWNAASTGQPLVFASAIVGKAFCENFWPELKNTWVIPQGIRDNPYQTNSEAVRGEVREELAIPGEALVICGSGFGDFRKGIDLFLILAATLKKLAPGPVAFIWIGDLDTRIAAYIRADLEKMGLEEDLHITGFTGDPLRYLTASDIFALTSREDPFPSVVMEAMSAGLPVAAFAGGGGYADIIGADTGALVPYLDVQALAEAVCGLAERLTREPEWKARLMAFAQENFTYDRYSRELLALFQRPLPANMKKLYPDRQSRNGELPRISIIVPNYNYARYLELRLQTIMEQTLAPHEIIILDDASTDSSVEVIERVIRDCPIPVTQVHNAVNGGNVFAQWLKGIELASGDIVWIAEADDYCELNFLENVARNFQDEGIAFAWCDSIMVDRDGASEGMTYRQYYDNPASDIIWGHDFNISGRELLQKALLFYNCVPNVSAVLFRKSALPDGIKAIADYSFSGDWFFWASLAMAGRVAYQVEPLNYHRRHQASVVHKTLKRPLDFLRESFRLWQYFYEIDPELFEPHVTLEFFRQLEKMYSNFPEQKSRFLWAKNNPELAVHYENLLEKLNPDDLFNPRVTTESAILIWTPRDGNLAVDMEAFFHVLIHQYRLTVILPEMPAKNHPFYALARKLDLKIRFAREKTLDLAADKIYCLGLKAAVFAAALPGEKRTSLYLVCDASYDAMGISGHGVEIEPMLALFRECATVYHLGDKCSHFAIRLIRGAGRISTRLEVSKFAQMLALRRKRAEFNELTKGRTVYTWDGIVM